VFDRATATAEPPEPLEPIEMDELPGAQSETPACAFELVRRTAIARCG
jgi:hypothetical protein